MIKKFSVIFMVVAIILFNFMPIMAVHAGVTDVGEGTINRITTTNYYTTIVADFSLPEKNLTYHKESTEIEGNISDDSVQSIIQSYKNELLTWFNAQNINGYVVSEGVSSSYYNVHDEITHNKDENSIIIGDIGDLDNAYAAQGTVTINTILDKYQVYTISLAKDESLINAVNVTLDAPKVGEEIKEDDNCLVSILTDNIELDYAHWVKGTAIEGIEDYDDNFVGTIEKEKYYYAMIGISTSNGFSLSNGLVIKVNGETPAEVFGIYNDSTHFIVKIKAVSEENEYKILDGANQVYKTDSTSNLVVRANGELSKLTGIKVDGNLISQENYSLKSGSTILTLKSSYLNTLSEGEHTLTFVYNDGSVDTTFTISNPSSNTNLDTSTTSNPQTGDNILFYISMLLLSLIGLIGTGLYIKRKRI